MTAEDDEVLMTPRATVAMAADRHPETGERVVCRRYEVGDAEGTTFTIWYTPTEFRALLAQGQQVLAQIAHDENA
jgi:hypothetical protein